MKHKTCHVAAVSATWLIYRNIAQRKNCACCCVTNIANSTAHRSANLLRMAAAPVTSVQNIDQRTDCVSDINRIYSHFYWLN